MTDTAKLRQKIKDSGYRIHFIAEKIGLSYQGLLNKVENKREFRAGEIIVLCDLLGIDAQERDTIFFCG